MKKELDEKQLEGIAGGTGDGYCTVTLNDSAAGYFSVKTVSAPSGSVLSATGFTQNTGVIKLLFGTKEFTFTCHASAKPSSINFYYREAGHRSVKGSICSSGDNVTVTAPEGVLDVMSTVKS